MSKHIAREAATTFVFLSKSDETTEQAVKLLRVLVQVRGGLLFQNVREYRDHLPATWCCCGAHHESRRSHGVETSGRLPCDW